MSTELPNSSALISVNGDSLWFGLSVADVTGAVPDAAASPVRDLKAYRWPEVPELTEMVRGAIVGVEESKERTEGMSPLPMSECLGLRGQRVSRASTKTREREESLE